MERTSWPYATKLPISLLLLGIFIYLSSLFNEIIPPIIIAVIIAYILNQIVNYLHLQIHIPRTVIILLMFVIVLAIIISFTIVIIPVFASSLPPTELNIQQYIKSLEVALSQQYQILGITFLPSAILDQVIVALRCFIQPVIEQTVSIVSSIIASIIWIIFIILVSFYLIKHGIRLEEWLTSHLPPVFLREYLWMHDEINQIWSSLFRGQLLLSFIVSIIFILAGSLLGLPFALLMGILAGILEFLPSIGHAIWLFIISQLDFFRSSTWIPIQNWMFMLIIIVLHLFFGHFDLNYLIPRIIGRSVHLPPLVVILGIVSAALLAGVLAIPLATPTIASARIIGRYCFANLFDIVWTPISVTQPLRPPKAYWWQRDQRKGQML